MNDKAHSQKDSRKQVLVLGGGIAGLSAARAMDHWGAAVHLVERDSFLGGHAFIWACMATDECQNCGACLSADIAEQAVHCKNVHSYLETEIGDVQRRGKGFQITLKGKHTDALTVDAVLIATGFEPFDPSQIESLRYSTHDKVITTPEFNRLLKHEGLTDFLSQNESPRIGFIQCVGSRNREQGRDYCSQVCCKVGLRQANKILDLLPKAHVSMFYMDLQIIGKEFRSQYHAIRDRIDLIQGVPGEILWDDGKGQLIVFQEDQKTGKPMAFHFDAIVLSVGMGPALGSSDLLKLFGAKVNQWGFLDEEWRGGIRYCGQQSQLGVRGVSRFSRQDHMEQEDYKLAIEARGDHLYVRASGVRTRATVTAMTLEIFDTAVTRSLTKVLIDVRELEGRLGMLDSYLMVTEVFQKLRWKGVHKAAIVDEQASSFRGWFLETVARNRGFNIRVFADQEEAREWLES